MGKRFWITENGEKVSGIMLTEEQVHYWFVLRGIDRYYLRTTFAVVTEWM